MSECILSKVITIRPNDKQWYDSKVRRYTKYRDRQRRIAIKKPTILNWSKYKKIRNKVNNLIKFTKRNFVSNIEHKIEDYSTNDSKCYWKSIKDLMKNYKTVDSIPVLKRNVSNTVEYCFTDEEKANCLNDYFVSVSDLDDSNSSLPPFVSKTNATLDSIVIHKSDIEDVIGNLDINKAVGPDLISHRVLKNVRHSISAPLTLLFNKSLDQGLFPSKWKCALVLPLFKKGDKTFPEIIVQYLF